MSPFSFIGSISASTYKDERPGCSVTAPGVPKISRITRIVV